MKVPAAKEKALRDMRLTWFAFIMSVVLYIYAGSIMKPSLSWLGFNHVGTILGLLSILDFFYFLLLWVKLYRPASEQARSQPDDARAIRRLQVGWTILVAMAESEVLFGLVFWMGSKTFTQSLPFFVLGVLMLLSLWPRQFWSSSAIATE